MRCDVLFRPRQVFGIGSTDVVVMPDFTLRFRYVADLHDPDTVCEFSLLSEVGEPYKPRFQEVMRKFKLTLGEPTELDEYPWFADTLKEAP